MPKAYLFVESQWDNLGDALLNRELIALMKAHAQVEIGLTKVPRSFRIMMGEQFLRNVPSDFTSGRSRFLLRILCEAVRGRKCFIFLSPGGWIGELDGRWNLRSWLHTILYYLLTAVGVKICQIGVSYEDIGPKLLLQLRVRSPVMYCHYVRDDLSRQTMEKKGIRIDGVCPDLAFSAFESENSSAASAVTFSFRGEQYPNQIEDIKLFIHFFLKVTKHPGPFYFVTQVKKDKFTNEALANWFQKEFGQLAVAEDGSSDIESTEKLYQRSNIVLSNRLHSLLLAGAVGNCMIAAPIGSANKKIRALFEDIGLGSNVFDTADDAYHERLQKACNTSFNAGRERAAVEKCFEKIFADDRSTF